MTELKEASSVKVLTAEGAACTTTVFAAEATAPAPAEPAAPAKAAGPWFCSRCSRGREFRPIGEAPPLCIICIGDDELEGSDVLAVAVGEAPLHARGAAARTRAWTGRKFLDVEPRAADRSGTTYCLDDAASAPGALDAYVGDRVVVKLKGEEVTDVTCGDNLRAGVAPARGGGWLVTLECLSPGAAEVYLAARGPVEVEPWPDTWDGRLKLVMAKHPDVPEDRARAALAWLCVECKRDGWVPAPLNKGWVLAEGSAGALALAAEREAYLARLKLEDAQRRTAPPDAQEEEEEEEEEEEDVEDEDEQIVVDGFGDHSPKWKAWCPGRRRSKKRGRWRVLTRRTARVCRYGPSGPKTAPIQMRTQTKDRDNAKMYKETTRVIWDEDLPSGTKKIPRKIKLKIGDVLVLGFYSSWKPHDVMGSCYDDKGDDEILEDLHDGMVPYGWMGGKRRSDYPDGSGFEWMGHIRTGWLVEGACYAYRAARKGAGTLEYQHMVPEGDQDSDYSGSD
ncbi:hypothetical protein JL721_10913 [Aureococcus anophagefferens]|nr:hypothetical protein JL721_10913 [Aureococcus anophagefferens]